MTRHQGEVVLTSHRPPLKDFQRCSTCSVHSLALCRSLGAEAIAALSRLARPRRFPEGAVITSEGEPSREVHNIVTGTVRLSKLLPDGREQIVGLLQPTDFLGCTFSECCAYTAVAVSAVELCSFDRRAFESLLRTIPEIEHAFLKEVLTELHAARDWMVVLGCKRGIERVASFLLTVVTRADREGCGKRSATQERIYELPLTRVDIGHYLGLSLETVSRQMSRLNGEGVIDLIDPRRFHVRDLDRLREIAGSPVEPAA